MALKFGQKGTGTMKWLPFMYSFVLEKMCGLIKTVVRTDKGLKEVHLTVVAKVLFTTVVSPCVPLRCTTT